ncbi:DUF4340 domain-containing protein [Leptothermofonsia sp. ETS-13]|uniref:DUF4340 domain-containing protein n=1 Tax=Leptothermofonsia sp. ETS-13 TaxID=3035696 RepID=UPI003BA1791A
MKIQRTPLILLAAALLLGTGVLLYETQVAPKQEEAKETAKKLFSFKEEDVQTLSLTTPLQTLSFEKKPAAAQPKSNQKQSSQAVANAFVWQMVAPVKTTANDAHVSYLLNLMSTSKQQQTITVPATQRAEFGFDQPMAIAEVKLKNQQIHRLILGKPNFDRTALYAQIDPPSDPKKDLSVVLVPIDFDNAVNRPLSEWQMQQKSDKSDKK